MQSTESVNVLSLFNFPTSFPGLSLDFLGQKAKGEVLKTRLLSHSLFVQYSFISENNLSLVAKKQVQMPVNDCF